MSLRKSFKSKISEKEQIELLKPISRQYFKAEQKFILNLFHATVLKSKEILLSANESQIITVLLILFFISNKQIPLSSLAHEKLKKNRKIRKLDTLFPNSEYLKSLLFTARSKQIEIIKPFISHLPFLVIPLVKLPKK